MPARKICVSADETEVSVAHVPKRIRIAAAAVSGYDVATTNSWDQTCTVQEARGFLARSPVPCDGSTSSISLGSQSPCATVPADGVPREHCAMSRTTVRCRGRCHRAACMPASAAAAHAVTPSTQVVVGVGAANRSAVRGGSCRRQCPGTE